MEQSWHANSKDWRGEQWIRHPRYTISIQQSTIETSSDALYTTTITSIVVNEIRWGSRWSPSWSVHILGKELNNYQPWSPTIKYNNIHYSLVLLPNVDWPSSNNMQFYSAMYIKYRLLWWGIIQLYHILYQTIQWINATKISISFVSRLEHNRCVLNWL